MILVGFGERCTPCLLLNLQQSTLRRWVSRVVRRMPLSSIVAGGFGFARSRLPHEQWLLHDEAFSRRMDDEATVVTVDRVLDPWWVSKVGEIQELKGYATLSWEAWKHTNVRLGSFVAVSSIGAQCR